MNSYPMLSARKFTHHCKSQKKHTRDFRFCAVHDLFDVQGYGGHGIERLWGHSVERLWGLGITYFRAYLVMEL